MSRLSREPSRLVETVAELRAVAAGVSMQVRALYRDLADRMAGFGNEPARAAFSDILAMQDPVRPRPPRQISVPPSVRMKASVRSGR